MNGRLLLHACIKFFAGVVLVGALVFLPAGTLRFWNAWLLMGVLFLPMLAAGLVMWIKAPELLRKRLDGREKQAAQRTVIGLSAIMFFVGFVLAGIDRRFDWTEVPQWLVWAGAAILLTGYLLFAEVLRENAYLSRSIKVQDGQKLVDTGLYGVVRHPMYSATLLLFLAMPLILGSWVSFVVFLTYPAIIVKRIRNEEAVLTTELEGYSTYCQRVKYRLVPYLW